jgi:preprotein translocase subunit YajC
MIDIAYAQAPGAAAPGGGFSMLVPLLLMFAVFYFLLIRPQQKKQRRHQDMKALKVGDRVITSGGLVGTIMEGGDQFVKLEIADRIRVEVGRGYIAGRIASPHDARELAGPHAEGQAGSGGFLGKLFGK